MLYIHSATFALYIISILLYFTFFTDYYYTDKHDSNRALNSFLISGMFSISCNFLSQVCLCAIFWQFASPKPELQ